MQILTQEYLRILCIFIILALGACSTPTGSVGTLDLPASHVSLFEPASVLDDNWRHLPIRGKTTYRLAAGDEGVVIRAVGNNSASGLIRTIELDAHKCPTLNWRWRVDALQLQANLKKKDGDDVAASLFILFGDPGFMSNPQPVPTLRYVWTNTTHQLNEIIDSPYLTGVVRSIVVRTGNRGHWITETRNLIEDYIRAFGAPPKDLVHAIALFTDNDQTREPAIAYYSWVHALCETVSGNFPLDMPMHGKPT